MKLLEFTQLRKRLSSNGIQFLDISRFQLCELTALYLLILSYHSLQKSQQNLVSLFVSLFVCMDAFPKEGSGYSIRDFASRPGTQKFFLPYAGSILTPQLMGIKRDACLDTKQPSRLKSSVPLKKPGCVHHPRLNPRYSAYPLQAILAFRWFPIHKPSSNSRLDYKAHHRLPLPSVDPY